MSEWTKERQEELEDIANDCGTNVFSHVRSRDLIDALEEIKRLQSEVVTLHSQQAELIEAGNETYKKFIGWFDVSKWFNAVNKITGGTDAHNG